MTIVLETCLDVAKGKNVTCGFFFHFYTQIHLPFLSSFCSSSSNPLTLLIYLSNKKDLSFVSTILRQKHLAMCFEVSRFKKKKKTIPSQTHTRLCFSWERTQTRAELQFKYNGGPFWWWCCLLIILNNYLIWQQKRRETKKRAIICPSFQSLFFAFSFSVYSFAVVDKAETWINLNIKYIRCFPCSNTFMTLRILPLLLPSFVSCWKHWPRCSLGETRRNIKDKKKHLLCMTMLLR